MIKRTLAILGVLAACLAWGDNPRLRIMPLGDSITEGVPGDGVECGGYRAPLYKLLTADGYNVDFVGTNTVRPGDLEHPRPGDVPLLPLTWRGLGLHPAPGETGWRHVFDIQRFV